MAGGLVRWRRPIVVCVQLALVVMANDLAFRLRFDGAVPDWAFILQLRMLPWLVAIRGLTFIPFRLNEGLWRYAGVWDLRNILAGVATSSLVFYLLVHGNFGIANYPRSVFVIDAILLVSFMGGIRLMPRIYREIARTKQENRVLIFGAGNAGEMIVRDMKNNPYYNYEPIGFVDDDRTKVGERIHGVPVLGTRRDIARIMADEQPHEVLVAIPRADARTIRAVVRALEPFKVPIKTLPDLQDIMNGKVAVSQIRSLAIEDLLPRAPVGLDPEGLRHLIAGKRVLVTGAGGSIGSELCRQIGGLKPASLVLYERYENSLYDIANDLADRGQAENIHALIGDVTDHNRLDAVLWKHRPEIIFHAAAHKHVPLMEQNACEAVKNNVAGTRILAEAAQRHRVERFILISSDKAVNPTSVMGTTKRVAELIVRAMARRSATCFMTVRFGNVLGSNGSVVPRFLEQIKNGGPVTVTHPDIRRYFMLIPEAVQLVLHAAALKDPGAIYVLEMGEQIRLLDMARNLIRLSGFVPDEDIAIAFVGLRPGEKLFEELVAGEEVVEPSPVDKILRVGGTHAPAEETLAPMIARLERLAAHGQVVGVIQQLCAIVPSFRPAGASRPTPAPERPAAAYRALIPVR